MAFPDTDLPIIIKAYIGADPADDPGSWPTPVDWSSLLIDKDITTSRGRRTGQNTAASGGCTFWLDDSDLAISTSDLTGTPVSVEVDDVGSSSPYGRFCGYIADVTTEVIPGVGGHEIVTVKVTLGGEMRQRTQGSDVRSPLYRAHRTGGTLADGLHFYWPLENATSGDLSPTEERDRIRVSPLGTGGSETRRYARSASASFAHFTFGSAGWSSESPPGSSGSVALSSAGVSFARVFVPGSRIPVIDFPSPSSPIRIGCAFKFADDLPDAPNDPGEKECTILRTVDKDNDNRAWAVRMITSSSGTVYNLDTFTINDAGTATHHSVTAVSLSLSVWHYIALELSSSGGGADTAYSLTLDGSVVHSGTATGVAYADSIDISVVNVGIDVPGVANVCHFGIWNGASLPSSTAGFVAMNGHRQELAHTRMTRVFSEDGIPFSTTATDSLPCGPQPIADPITIAQDAESVDHGILGEDTTTWGFTYRASYQRYGQDAAFTIDLATYNVAEGQSRNVLRPIRNDQRLRNEWTVTRVAGSSTTVRDEDSIAKRGPYRDSATVNLASDYPLNNEASWRVREGVYGGRRWGSVPVDFGENLTLLSAWLETELGDRIDRTGHALSYLERLDLQGYTERLRRTSWTADLYVEPHSLWGDVMVAADRDSPGTDPSRASHPGSTLTSAINTTVGSAAVTNLPAISWGTDDLPYGLNIDGELVTVTAVSGTGSSQTLTITRSVNGVVKAHAAGTPVQIWRPVHAAL